MGEIKRLTKFAVKHETDFAKIISEQCGNSLISDIDVKKKELANLRRRDSEIDNILGKLYEDNLSGKITDGRYAKMFANYEKEQSGILERIKIVTMEVGSVEDKQMASDTFIQTVRKYTRAKTLSERMLNELIKKVVVYQAEKVDGVYVQKLEIHWNCAGVIEFPEEVKKIYRR